MEFVGPVADGVEVAAALHQRIHAIIDRDEADTLGREVQFRQFTDLQVLAAQAGHILHDQGTYQPRLDKRHDVLPRGTVEVGAAVAVIRHEHGVLKAVVGGVLLQIAALVDDAVAVTGVVVLLTQAAIQDVHRLSVLDDVGCDLTCHVSSFLKGKPMRYTHHTARLVQSLLKELPFFFLYACVDIG